MALIKESRIVNIAICQGSQKCQTGSIAVPNLAIQV